MQERKVSLFSFIRIFKSKKRIGFIGLIFSIMPIVVIVPMLITINASKEKFQTYNYKEISEKGVEQNAAITDVIVKHNVSINGVNPIVLAYEYKNANNTVDDKFETLEIEKADQLKAGDSITIKVYNAESAVAGLEPYSFPFEKFLIMPFIFLFIGVPLLLTSLLPALRDFKLYKTGTIHEGQVEYMTQHDGLPITGIGQKTVVGYSYVSHGTKVFGESSTTDSMVLYEKKRGDAIKIFVSEDGKRSCLIPRIEAIKNGWNIDIA